VVRTLADQARRGQLGSARPQLLQSLIRTYGVAEAEELLWDYLSTLSPKRWSTDEGDQFAAWFSALTRPGSWPQPPTIGGEQKLPQFRAHPTDQKDTS
jgi:hypothetical protein